MSYVGRDPLPDTFKDGAQALVEGKMMPDNRFVAEQVQAKCASKYEADARRRAGRGSRAKAGTNFDWQPTPGPQGTSILPAAQCANL